MPRKIIVDSDHGQDDAVAILMALGSPDELEIPGIVAVVGNVPLSRTIYNARQILELARRTDVPLFAGCARPMRRRLVTAKHVHGEIGLDGPSLPAPTMRVEDQHGVLFIIASLRTAMPAEITLVTLGPLTDVAMAMVLTPEIAERIAEIVMIFGSFSEGGNITPAADFNDCVDSEAADPVLNSGVKITIVSMDVTHPRCHLSTGARIVRRQTGQRVRGNQRRPDVRNEHRRLVARDRQARQRTVPARSECVGVLRITDRGARKFALNR
jgi:purine nucleosidase